MNIIKEKDAIILEPQNDSQIFFLGRLQEKFPFLGLVKIVDDLGGNIKLKIPDTSLIKFLLDSVENFKN